MNKIEGSDKLILISKIGFDGCTGQSVYMQLTSEESEMASIAVKESLFLTCMVPLQLRNRSKGDAVQSSGPTRNPPPHSFAGLSGFVM